MSSKALPAALAGAALLFAGLPKDKKIDHALQRLTFGPRPGDHERVRSLGLNKWIQGQLHPDRITEDPALEAKLQSLETLRLTPVELAQKYPRRSGPGQGVQVIARELVEAKLLRAVYSRRQLAEVLTDFWFNHFNVFFDKGADRYLVTAYERDAIRPHVLGSFPALLRATAEHPAMLFYLDNWQSIDPQAAARLRRPVAKRARGLNENYARELLELHTLGVDGGYTQQDVIEVARCFTGWTIRDPRSGGGFSFNERMHDRGEKSVLGHKIAAGRGVEDGLQVLEIVARHPSTARFISRKLAQRFVADDPPPSLVAKMAKTFTRTNGDVRAVLKTMLGSREFWSERLYRSKMKSPLELVASALRSVDAQVSSAAVVGLAVARLGQPLYRKPEPTGYSNSSEEWVNTAGLLHRMNFALALASNRLPGVKVDAGPDAGLRLGSPEFQRR
jgi:uncharacterized protein (DUF1800 family)